MKTKQEKELLKASKKLEQIQKALFKLLECLNNKDMDVVNMTRVIKKKINLDKAITKVYKIIKTNRIK